MPFMPPPAAKKPGRPADPQLGVRRREEILEAAAALFARHGYSQTDTQVLADKLQVGKGTLYRYFSSKQELFLAAVDRVMHKLRETIDAGIEAIEDPLERIARAVHLYLDFFAEHPEFVELLVQERAQFKDRKRPTYFQHRDANVKRWWDMYRSLIEKGRLRSVPVERITEVFGNLLYGTVLANYFAGQRRPPAEQARDVLDIVFHGILSESERRRRSQE
jgi:AcrR family transcriptional regulator